jgi:hypothetical protein
VAAFYSSLPSFALDFRIGKPTVSSVVFKSCEIIWDELIQEFLHLPHESLLGGGIVSDFYKSWNFSNCFGCIEGIQFPPLSISAYFSYQKLYQVALQGVADDDKKFLVIDMGGNGKQGDGGTSQFFDLLEKNEFNVPPDQQLPGTSMKAPNFLTGDEAYDSKECLMRPYPRRVLTPQRGSLQQAYFRHPESASSVHLEFYIKNGVFYPNT